MISHCEEPKSGECRTNHRVPLAGEACGEKSHVEVQLEKGKKKQKPQGLKAVVGLKELAFLLVFSFFLFFKKKKRIPESNFCLFSVSEFKLFHLIFF